jgi:hypothetical protein
MTVTTAPPQETAGQVARRRWRSSRGILVAVLAIVALGVLLAALRPTTRPEFLDPDSPGQQGTRALAQITRQHGTPVTVARSTAQAARELRASPDALLVVTRSERLVAGDLNLLRDAPGDRLLIEPTDETLAALAPGVARTPVGTVTPEPGCTLPEAIAAGNATFADADGYRAPPSATRCYPAQDRASLVRLPVNGETVTVLGSGRLLTNERLTENGDAALGMNLLATRSAVVWLTPGLPPPGQGARKSFTQLLPFGVKLAVLQLVIAVALVALWRARRLGPVVVERLPVIVRSAEAVEGRARLYQARRATERAAQALRAGSLERLTRLLGMPSSGGDPVEIAAALASHTGYDRAEIASALFGPPPPDDAGLVRLAGYLDALERQVRNP